MMFWIGMTGGFLWGAYLGFRYGRLRADLKLINEYQESLKELRADLEAIKTQREKIFGVRASELFAKLHKKSLN